MIVGPRKHQAVRKRPEDISTRARIFIRHTPLPTPNNLPSLPPSGSVRSTPNFFFSKYPKKGLSPGSDETNRSEASVLEKFHKRTYRKLQIRRMKPQKERMKRCPSPRTLPLSCCRPPSAPQPNIAKKIKPPRQTKKKFLQKRTFFFFPKNPENVSPPPPRPYQ